MTQIETLNQWEVIDGPRHYFISEKEGLGGAPIFMYGYHYADGTGGRTDWAQTYREARKFCNTSLHFRRVK